MLAVTFTIPDFWAGVIVGALAAIAVIVVLAVVFDDEITHSGDRR